MVLRNGNEYLTWSIIGLCCAMWAYSYFAKDRYNKASTTRNRKPIQIIDDHFVISLRNQRQGRTWIHLTHSFTHFQIEHLLFNMVSLASLGPRFLRIHGLGTFAVVWVGSAVAGGLVDIRYWAKSERSGYIKQAVGASGAICGFSAVLGCTMPYTTVSFVGISMPLYIYELGFVAFSIACLRQGWLPQLGHLGHLGGWVFGVFWWAVRLNPALPEGGIYSQLGQLVGGDPRN